MKLKDLEKAGGFVSADGERKSLTWKNREGQEFTFDIFVKRTSYGLAERIALADDGESRGALSISECILFGTAGERLTYEQAFALEPSLARVFMTAIREVNERKKDDPAKN